MVTLAELRAKHQKLIEETDNGEKKGNNNYLTLNPGDNWVRILPGKEEALDFFSESTVHKIKRADGKYTSYQCRKPENEKCPICDFYFDLWKRHKELGLPKGEKSKFGDLATAIKPKSRYYVRVVSRALQLAKEDPVKFVAMSKQLFDRVMGAITNPDLCDDNDPDNTTIVSLNRGNDFNIRITDQGGFTSFVESSAKIKKQAAGSPAEMAEWMDSQLDVKSLVKIGDYDEGKKLVMEMDSMLSGVDTVKLDSRETPPFNTDEENENKFKKELKA